MWKKFVSLLGLSLVTVLLVSCQSSGQTEQQKATKIVETEMGKVEVPTKPKNVLVNWYIHDVVSLGVTPAGYFGWAQEAMPKYKEMKEIPVIKKWEKEELLSYEPDLIISYDKEDYKKFSKIAPVVVISEKMTPEERLDFLGEVLGKEKEAEAIIKEFNQKLTRSKESFAKEEFKGKTFSIFEDWGSGSYGVYYETGSRGGKLLYDYIGLAYPDKLKELVEKTSQTREGLSYEVAADYFGDYIIWFLQPGFKESEFQKTKIWETIPAVKENRVLIVPGELNGLFYYSDVLSMSHQLDYFTSNFDKLVQK